MGNAEVLSKADLHIHSNHSDGVASIPEIMDHVTQNTDLRVIAITDHNTIDGALYAKSLEELYDIEVIVGEEISARQGHVIGLFLQESIPAGMCASDTVRAIIEQDGIAIVPHPFSAQGVFGPLGSKLLAGALDDWGFHGMETYNSLFYLGWANRLATRMLQHGHRIAATGGSDAHVLEAIGKGHTVFAGTTAEDLRVALLDRSTSADSEPQGLSVAWRLALNLRNIRRNHSLNWERCKA